MAPKIVARAVVGNAGKSVAPLKLLHQSSSTVDIDQDAALQALEYKAANPGATANELTQFEERARRRLSDRARKRSRQERALVERSVGVHGARDLHTPRAQVAARLAGAVELWQQDVIVLLETHVLIRARQRAEDKTAERRIYAYGVRLVATAIAEGPSAIDVAEVRDVPMDRAFDPFAASAEESSIPAAAYPQDPSGVVYSSESRNSQRGEAAHTLRRTDDGMWRVNLPDPAEPDGIYEESVHRIVDALITFRQKHIHMRCEICRKGSNWVECQHNDGVDFRGQGRRGGAAMPVSIARRRSVIAGYDAANSVRDLVWSDKRRHAAGRLATELLRLCGITPHARHALALRRSVQRIGRIDITLDQLAAVRVPQLGPLSTREVVLGGTVHDEPASRSSVFRRKRPKR